MNAPVENVFNQINTLKNWEKWSPRHKKDTAMKLTYEGPAKGVGAKYLWESKNSDVGTGNLSIKESKPNEMIVCEMVFGNMKPSSATFKFEKADNGTKVIWTMDSDAGMNPLYKYFGLFMDKMVGPDFEKGLNNIKDIAEKMPPPSKTPDDAMKIMNTIVPQMNLLTVRVKCSEKKISNKLGESYGNIGAYAKKNGANKAGAPMAIYYKWGKDGFEFDAACPFDKKLPGEGDVKGGEIKAGNVVMVNYYGDYSKIKPAHDMIQDYIKSNNKKTTGAPWEVYAKDPGKVTDTAKWLTQVYYPVE
jgi:effector-binding domain-containing protein